MAKTETVGSRVEGFSESTSTLAAKLNNTFGTLEALQHSRMVMTSGDVKLTAKSYSAPAGSPERRLLDALALRRALADVLKQYGQLVSALAKGVSGEEVKTRGVVFQAASDQLETLNGGDAIGKADSELEKDEESAAPKDLSPREAELLAVKNKTVGVLGFVSSVAMRSTAGKVSKVLVIVNQRVTNRIRQKKGEAELCVMTPKAQADVEKLSTALADSHGPLEETTDHLVEEILKWHNKQPTPADDPSRIPYELDVASMLKDARAIKSSLKAITDAYGKLGPAHQDIVNLLTAKSDDRSASDVLLKFVHHAAKS